MAKWLKILRVGAGALSGAGTVPVLIIIAILAFGAWSSSKGAAREALQCRSADLEATVAAQRASLLRIEEQLARANEARDVARARAERDATILRKEREEADAFKDELAVRAHHCPVSADDAERLRRIGQ
ncbi:MAG: hypothetical protein MK098_14970 [Marinovum sp.]|nr:hypothetical protein [Marinovum sp.]